MDDAKTGLNSLPSTFGRCGYGLLGLTIPWAPVDSDAAIQLMKTAFDQGARLWNGSTHYGTPEANSTHLLKKYFGKYPEHADKVFLMLKGAYSMKTGPDASPEGVAKAVDEAYAVLKGVKTIDVFATSRVDPKVQIETTIEALAVAVQQGKIKGIGLSEVSAATIRRAAKIHPIVTAEIELSLFTPDPVMNGILEACKDCGVQAVAYSPIGRGWLTDNHHTFAELPENDFRRMLPRFQQDAVQQNTRLASAVQGLAQKKGCTTAQIALAWVIAQGAIPIPGSKSEQRVVENCTEIALSSDDLAELQHVIDSIPVAGMRYGGEHEKLLNA